MNVFLTSMRYLGNVCMWQRPLPCVAGEGDGGVRYDSFHTGMAWVIYQYKAGLHTRSV